MFMIRACALVAVLVFPACQGPDGQETSSASDAQDPSMVVGEWRLDRLTVNGEEVEFLGRTPVWIGIADDGRYTGGGPCNAFGGTLTVSEDRLTVHTLGAETMGCEAPVGTAEADLFRMLDGDPTWTVNGEALLLRAAGVEARYLRGRSQG